MFEFTGHAGPVNVVEFHPNEYLLASGSSDRYMRGKRKKGVVYVSSTFNALPFKNMANRNVTQLKPAIARACQLDNSMSHLWCAEYGDLTFSYKTDDALCHARKQCSRLEWLTNRTDILSEQQALLLCQQSVFSSGSALNNYTSLEPLSVLVWIHGS